MDFRLIILSQHRFSSGSGSKIKICNASTKNVKNVKMQNKTNSGKMFTAF